MPTSAAQTSRRCWPSESSSTVCPTDHGFPRHKRRISRACSAKAVGGFRNGCRDFPAGPWRRQVSLPRIGWFLHCKPVRVIPQHVMRAFHAAFQAASRLASASSPERQAGRRPPTSKPESFVVYIRCLLRTCIRSEFSARRRCCAPPSQRSEAPCQRRAINHGNAPKDTAVYHASWRNKMTIRPHADCHAPDPRLPSAWCCWPFACDPPRAVGSPPENRVVLQRQCHVPIRLPRHATRDDFAQPA